jgi:hypothetical protein
MPELGPDFETRGVVDLRRVGAHKYAAHPDSDVLCVAFAKDDGAIELWVPGAPCPELIVRSVMDGWTLCAFNANFERLIWHHILTPRYGWPEPRLEQWRCTQAAAQASALPNNLEGVAAALRLPFQKDPDGYAAMLRLSRPRKPKKDEAPQSSIGADATAISSFYTDITAATLSKSAPCGAALLHYRRMSRRCGASTPKSTTAALASISNLPKRRTRSSRRNALRPTPKSPRSPAAKSPAPGKSPASWRMRANTATKCKACGGDRSVPSWRETPTMPVVSCSGCGATARGHP